MINIPSEVKALLQKDGIKKNFRIHFPNGERADIINTNLVQGSVSLTESLCSRDKLKFGLCETPCLEFKTMHVENIKGMTIEAQMEIDVSSCIDEAGECSFEYEQREDLNYPTYPISYGEFIVQSCEREGSSLQRRKVEAYSLEYEFKISSIERWKQGYTVSTNAAYAVDMLKFLASNIAFLNKDSLELSEVSFGNNKYNVGMNPIKYNNSPYYIKWTVIASVLAFASSKNTDIDLYGKGHNTDYAELFYLDFERNKGEIHRLDEWLLQYGYSVDATKSYRTSKTSIEKYTFPTFGVYGLSHDNCLINNFLYPMMPQYYTSSTSTTLTVPTMLKVDIYESYSTLMPSDPIDTLIITVCETPRLYQVNLENNGFINGIEFKEPRKKVSGGYSVHPVQEDIREIFEAYLELNGLFGQIDRKTNHFETISLAEKGGLVPSETLTPSDTLTPSGGVSQLITKKMYRQCWYDDEPTLPYGKVSVTYSNVSDEVVTAELYLNGLNEDSYNDAQYQTYDLSENYIIQNNTFDADTISEILEKVGAGIESVQYMPAEISMNYGLPYLEIGDYVTVMLANAETFDTLVLRRTISGIQALKDNYESKG